MDKIIIVGAGVAGLSAGIYARRNGYETTIYESHSLPGGMCTAWRRRGFTFEGCLHYVQLVGASPAHAFYPLWKELGVIPNTKMIHNDVFHTFQDRSGRTLNMYTDANRLEQELLSLSPSDESEIRKLCAAIRRCSWLIRRAGKNPLLLIVKAASTLGAIPLLKEYGDMDLAEYVTRFNDPLIRSAFSRLFVYPDFAFIQFCFFLAGLHIRGAAYPQGGSLALAKTIERTFVGLEGKIEYRKRVSRIQVQDGRAAGIELEDGTTDQADIVISAADGRTTLFDMLGDQFTPPAVRERYAVQPLYHPFVQVSLGVNRDLSGKPHVVKVQTAAPFEIAGQTRYELWYQHFAFDPTMAPPGKTPVTVLYPSDLARWEELGHASEAYKAEKKRILDTTIAQLEHVLPGISSQVEVSDVATPFTTFRYTSNWRGALGFVITQKLVEEMTMKPQYALPGLERFYMIGQWVKGFGVPNAASSGKAVIQEICRVDGKRFAAV